jgi:hypothetical protein
MIFQDLTLRAGSHVSLVRPRKPVKPREYKRMPDRYVLIWYYCCGNETIADSRNRERKGDVKKCANAGKSQKTQAVTQKKKQVQLNQNRSQRVSAPVVSTKPVIAVPLRRQCKQVVLSGFPGQRKADPNHRVGFFGEVLTTNENLRSYSQVKTIWQGLQIKQAPFLFCNYEER